MRCVFALMSLGLVAAGGCKKERPEVVAARERAKEMDKDAAELLATPDHADAREWLSKPTSMGFEVSVADMRTMTEELYRRGALKVWVAGISTLGEREISALLVVELPASADARRAVFEWYASLGEEMDPVADVGQRYLKVILD